MYYFTRFLITCCLTIALTTFPTYAVEQPACSVQTLDQISVYIQKVILKHIPDARFSSEEGKFLFRGDFRDTSFYQRLQNEQVETVGRFLSDNSGVGGIFTINDSSPSQLQSTAKSEKYDNSILTLSSVDQKDGYYNEINWSVSVPAYNKTLSVNIFYIRGTSPAFLEDLISVSKMFGSCHTAASFLPIDEEQALELAMSYAANDSAAGEIIRHDPQVVHHSLPGTWFSKHEIVFRGGCCCACDGECEDISVRMTSNGALSNVKVKHWVCGVRNKINKE